MQDKLQHLKKMYSKLVNSNFLKWNQIKDLDKICGVYLIYSDDNSKKLIYIGSTRNFKVRFGTDLKHSSTHTLIKKLRKQYNFGNADAFEYISRRCLFRIIQCNSEREAEAVEHFAIWVLDPTFNK